MYNFVLEFYMLVLFLELYMLFLVVVVSSLTSCSGRTAALWDSGTSTYIDLEPGQASRPCGSASHSCSEALLLLCCGSTAMVLLPTTAGCSLLCCCCRLSGSRLVQSGGSFAVPSNGDSACIYASIGHTCPVNSRSSGEGGWAFPRVAFRA